MATIVVIENVDRWKLEIPGVQVVSAKDYLTQPSFADRRRLNVFNLCRSYRYQSTGYYVSLLAAARGHRALPSVKTLQDMRETSLLRFAGSELEDVLERSLGDIKADRFELSVYFGRNLAKRHDRLARMLFSHFPAPLLRAVFVRADRWRLHSLQPIAGSDIPSSHQEFVVQQAQSFFSRAATRQPKQYRWELAILINEDEVDAPSDARAIQNFVNAGEKLDVDVSIIDKDDFGRVAEFDGLFLRETTYVNHHTFRFASRAHAEGIVVIDDPESILRCTNKVYQAEAFGRHGIAQPKTLVVHQGNRDTVGAALGFPCVIKRPDSSFSAGVVKARDEKELKAHLDAFFELSELVVAQEFVPSEFDWRIGVLGGEPLYACKYHMARGHWQIQKALDEKRRSYGKTDTLPVADAPAKAVDLAVRASALVGDGLYGVDIKEVEGRFMVMEVNDNPSIEAGCEDAVLKSELYERIMRHFVRRFEQRGAGVRT